jgi:hypothetical protein
MLKEITKVSKKNKKPIIKSIELDLALIIGVDSNPTIRIHSLRVILVNSKIIIDRNLI